MAKRARLLVVCGTGIATSTAAENRVVELLSNRGYNVSTSQCIAAEVNAKSQSIQPDAIITTTKLKINKIQDNGKTRHEIDGVPGIPAFNGVPFLTGIGEEKLIDRICAALDEAKMI
jgi:galactitol PTS system EIIB component